MKSQWFGFKSEVIAYRKKGNSFRMIEKKFGVPRSTLSGWLRGVVLTSRQKDKLLKNWRQALDKARKKAIKWHNAQKQMRLQQAKKAAEETIKTLNIRQRNILELALAMLYLGEGYKSSPETIIGNSNPQILKFFIKALCLAYNFDRSRIRCELHLRADQNPAKIKEYWSSELSIPLRNFTTVSIDMRTKGSITYNDYKGVCVLRCGNVAIQRKLLFLAENFCNKVILQ